MRKRNPSIRPLFTAIIVLALGYNDWRLYQKLVTLRLLETGAQTRARYQRQIAALNHQADLWEAKADALVRRPESGGTTETKTAASDTQKWANEVRGELVAAWIDRVYGPFFKKLALNPNDLARLKALITEKRQAILDAIDTAHAQGITDMAGLRDAILEAVKKSNGETQALLGEDNYARFRQYQASLPARSAMDEFTAALPASAGLSPEQHDSLLKIIAQGQAPASRASSVVENLLTSVPAPVTAKDVADAATLLNPAQLGVLQELQHQAALRRELLRLLYP